MQTGRIGVEGNTHTVVAAPVNLLFCERVTKPIVVAGVKCV